MEEKKSKINKKVFVLILLVILLVSSTYAWFTTNRNVRVESIEAEVATTGNIEISADAVKWKTSITSAELLNGIHNTYAGAVNQIPEDGIYPMSTAGIINNGKIDMFYGQVKLDNATSTYSLTANKEAEVHGTEGRYIAFDIFLKVVEDTTVYLNPNTIVNSETTKSGSTGATGIENATRIAFLVQGNASSAAEAQGLNGATDAIIIEPNYDVHTAAGVQNAQNVYGISGLDLIGNEAVSYYGIKNEITTGVELTDTSSTYFSQVNPDIKLAKSFFSGTEKTELFTLSAGITKVRVYLWIEGQDVDCEDTASGANMSFALQFTT